MAVEVQDEPYLSGFIDLVEKCLNSCNFWTIKVFLCCIPFPVEILAGKVRPVVPENYPVYVHHRYDVKYIVFEQEICLFIFDG